MRASDRAMRIIGAKSLFRLAEEGIWVIDGEELRRLRALATAAKAIRDGYSEIRWKDLCEAIDELEVTE